MNYPDAKNAAGQVVAELLEVQNELDLVSASLKTSRAMVNSLLKFQQDLLSLDQVYAPDPQRVESSDLLAVAEALLTEALSGEGRIAEKLLTAKNCITLARMQATADQPELVKGGGS